MVNFGEQLKSFISELVLELQMRQKVWKRIKGQEHKFLDGKHQSRYNTMRLMKKVFDEMTERELQTIVERIKRKSEEEQRQRTLF